MSTYWLAEFLTNLEAEMPQAETEYVSAMIGIVSRHGKLANGDGNGIWVGYVNASENENVSIGVKCSNCAFYESKGVCKIVSQEIEDDGYCRLAAIPDGIVKGNKK